MSEELLQRNLIKSPEKIGKWDFYNIGATSVKALKEYGIIRDVSYGAVENKKVDGLIVQRKNVIAVVEYKKPSEFKTKAQQNKAIKQEIEVAQKLGAKIFIATDTKDTVWVNALTENRILDWEGNEVKEMFDPTSEQLPELIEKINDSINEQNDNIKPKQLINPTDLAKSIWQDVWSVSGATPENCLYTFVELFIFKYLSDLEVLEEPEDFKSLMALYAKRDDEYVLEYYANNIRPKIKTLFPEGSDGTTIINGTIFVSKAQKAVKGYSRTFRNVLKKFEDYGKLEYIDYDFKSKLFESFLKESISKKNWGQFFTPLNVVRSIVEMAKDDIKPGVKICDPACGVGKFLLEPIVTKLDEYYDITGSDIKPKITIHGFDKGFDKDEQKTIILAKANMLIYFSDLIKDNPGLTEKFAQLFNESFTLKTNSILGTLSDDVENEYDLILTNPPYVTSGSGNLKDEIKKDGDLVNYYKINAMGVEGLFMEWIIRALKPGGKAFVVIPDGILSRQNDQNLRRFILQECYLEGIISLPLKTFFTTPKKTYILILTKKTSNVDVQKDPVFTYLVSEIGESRDVYRFDIEQNDLNEAVSLFNGYKGSKDYFIKHNKDARCKIQPVSVFKPDKHWVIDRWWTKEEKIKLGIVEEEKVVPLNEFPDLLDEITDSITGFREEVAALNEKKNQKITYKTFEIGDVFDFPSTNSKITKTFCEKHKGSIPVYASSKSSESVLGYIKDNLEGITYYEDCLSWNRNGSVGYVFIRDHKFTTNEDHRALVIKNEFKDNVSKGYLQFEIEKRLFENDFSFLNKCGVDKIKKVQIQLPVDENDNPDLKQQEQLLEKLKEIKEIKENIEDYRDKLQELTVEIKTSDMEHLNVPITNKDYFELQRGKRITKTTIDKNRGHIPVYSSSKNESGTLGSISEKYLLDNDLIVYDRPAVLFNLDGSVGYCFIRKGKKYSFIDVVAALVPKNKNIDLEYLLYKLREEILKTGADYQSKLYFNKIRDYEISIQLPVDHNGNPDLAEQQRIAQKYKKVEEIKRNISRELDKALETEVRV